MLSGDAESSAKSSHNSKSGCSVEILQKRNRTLQNPSVEDAGILIANNTDLLEQIFIRCPPKSLLRLQLVSKKWLSVISDPAFHRLWSPRKALFLFRWNPGKRTPKELNFVSLSDGYADSIAGTVFHLNNLFENGQILDFHSCNGLLALVFKLNDYDDHREFVVYNPVTRQHRLIPMFNSPDKPNDLPQLNDPDDPNFDPIEVTRRFDALNIAFDPSESDRYKLVYVWLDDYFCAGTYIFVCGFAVYESETGIWRKSSDTLDMYPPDLHFTYFSNGVLWNGGLHWVSNWKRIVCFDLNHECLRPEMPSLPVEFNEGELWYFGESNGSLYVIEVNNPSELLFDVFEMAKDYSNWVLKYHLNLSPLKSLYPSMVNERFKAWNRFLVHPLDERQCEFGMVCFLEDEKKKKASIVISLQRKLILYNIHDEVVRELAEVGELDANYDFRSQFYQWKDTYRHMETLVQV